MSMDMTFLSDSYTQQILHQLRSAEWKKASENSNSAFGSILSSKDSASKAYFVQSKEAAGRRAQEMQDYQRHKMMTDQIRLDLTGERGVLTDRGTDWISALAYLRGGTFR